jgi:hypothetical protein
MSGWPWMKDIKVTIADPIPLDPASEENDQARPSVKTLLLEYEELIDQVRKQLELENPLYDPDKHDDLWIVRFLISHKGNVSRAIQAAETTLEFRHSRKLDERDIRGYPPQNYNKKNDNDNDKNDDDDDNNNIYSPSFQRFMNGGVGDDSISEVVPDVRNGTVHLYINVVSMETHQLAQLDVEYWIAGMCYVNEWSFQWLDYMTRTTGRLTKAVRIVDVAGIQLSMEDRQCQDKYTSAIRVMQDCYPQAVGIILVCHAPIWIQIPWYILRPLMPQRVVAKIDFINPKQRAQDLQRILTYIKEEHLPERFGGKCTEWPPVFPLELSSTPPPSL